MEKTPLRIFDYTVTKDWSIEKAAIYARDVTNMIRFMEKRGKPLTIEYIDENLNVVSTVEYEGNEEKYLEYEAKINNLVELMKKERQMSLSQQFLDKEDKKSNIYLNSDYAQLRVDIFKILYGVTDSEKQAELLVEDVLEAVDKFERREVLNDPDHKCSLCGEEFPHLIIKNEFTGQSYCSKNCLETDEMVTRADCEQ